MRRGLERDKWSVNRFRYYRPVMEELENRLVLSPPGSGWQLSFEDTFQGTALDPSIWRVDTAPRRNAINTASAISVDNGFLTITTYTSGGTHYTGFIDIRNAFHAAFGYWEARIKFQDTQGQWSAFWIESPTIGNPIGDPATAGAEIDIVEHRRVDGNGVDVSNKAQNTLHWDGYGAYHRSVGQLSNNPTGTSLQGNFHTYGLLWTPDRYVYYVDGIQVWTTNQAVSHRSEYMLLTSEVENNSWAGHIPTGGYGSLATSTTKMTVNWVRVWEMVPAIWSDRDIGSPGRPGGTFADRNTGIWTVSGGGSDIWNTSDQFHFAYQSFTGDGSATARVASLSNTDPWAKAGVMFRDSSLANAPFADVVVTPGNGVDFQWRASQGGQPGSINLAGFTAPLWVQLVRSGNDFTASYSTDDINWNQIGTTQTIAMNSSALVGLAVTAHNNAVINTAAFTNVSVLPVNWADMDIGAVGRPGNAYQDTTAGTWTVAGGGADIWGTADAFHYVYLPLAGDGWIFAQVTSVSPTDVWAKAGVMIRETLDANSRHAMVVVTSQQGVSFQRRISTGGSSVSDTLAGVLAPYAIYLERVGDTFNAWGTADYVNYDYLGTDTIPMTSQVYIGLAVTSHNNSLLNTALFDSVSTSLDSGGAPGARGPGRCLPGRCISNHYLTLKAGSSARALSFLDRTRELSTKLDFPGAELVEPKVNLDENMAANATSSMPVSEVSSIPCPRLARQYCSDLSFLFLEMAVRSEE